MRASTINHISYAPGNSFDDFTVKLEKQLERPTGISYENVLAERATARPAKGTTESPEAARSLMVFATYDQGGLLKSMGSVRKARLYVIGNPLDMARMAQHDIRTALYTPFPMLVFLDSAGHVKVDYDQPSSVFRQFNHPSIDVLARAMDVRLATLVQTASADFYPPIR